MKHEEIDLVVTLDIPKGKEGEVLAAARHCVIETRKEPGCLSYRACFEQGHEGRVVFLERWKDEASLHAHNSSAHLAALLECVRKTQTTVAFRTLKEIS